MRYVIRAKVWQYSGPGGWHFVTLPREQSEAIRAFAPGRRPAFGSIAVSASINGFAWRTSLFPDTKRRALLLPLKADIRRKTKIAAGDTVAVTLDISA